MQALLVHGMEVESYQIRKHFGANVNAWGSAAASFPPVSPAPIPSPVHDLRRFCSCRLAAVVAVAEAAVAERLTVYRHVQITQQ